MKIISYDWLDDHLLGGVKIECDCGHVFEKETLSGDGERIIACPKCKTHYTFFISVDFVFERIAGSIVTHTKEVR